MDQRVAEGTREVGVHLDQNQCTVPDQVHLIDRTDRKGHVTVVVHGRNGADHNGTPVLVLTALERLA